MSHNTEQKVPPIPLGIQQDIGRFVQLKHELEAISKAQSTKKEERKRIEGTVIDMLVKLNKRYITGSGQEEGPFITLNKKSSGSSWSQENYVEFFEKMFTEFRTGRKFTAEELAEKAKQFIQKFEKRSLKLEIVTRKPHRRTCEDLIAWLKGKDDEAVPMQ